MNEADEVASNLPMPPLVVLTDVMRVWVKHHMPDESVTVIDNVTEAMMSKQNSLLAQK